MQPVHPDGVVGGWLWAHLESKGLHDRVKNPQNLLHIRPMNFDGGTVIRALGHWDADAPEPDRVAAGEKHRHHH